MGAKPTRDQLETELKRKKKLLKTSVISVNDLSSKKYRKIRDTIALLRCCSKQRKARFYIGIYGKMALCIESTSGRRVKTVF